MRLVFFTKMILVSLSTILAFAQPIHREWISNTRPHILKLDFLTLFIMSIKGFLKQSFLFFFLIYWATCWEIVDVYDQIFCRQEEGDIKNNFKLQFPNFKKQTVLVLKSFKKFRKFILSNLFHVMICYSFYNDSQYFYIFIRYVHVFQLCLATETINQVIKFSLNCCICSWS